MNFRKQYGGSLATPEKGSGEILVEQAGYVSAKQRITNLMLAGQRLLESRRAQYDFPAGSEIDESFSDPLRRPGIDMAEVSQMQMAVEDRLKASQIAQEARVKAPDPKPVPEDPEKTD